MLPLRGGGQPIPDISVICVVSIGAETSLELPSQNRNLFFLNCKNSEKFTPAFPLGWWLVCQMIKNQLFLTHWKWFWKIRKIIWKKFTSRGPEEIFSISWYRIYILFPRLPIQFIYPDQKQLIWYLGIFKEEIFNFESWRIHRRATSPNLIGFLVSNLSKFSFLFPILGQNEWEICWILYYDGFFHLYHIDHFISFHSWLKYSWFFN